MRLDQGQTGAEMEVTSAMIEVGASDVSDLREIADDAELALRV